MSQPATTEIDAHAFPVMTWPSGDNPMVVRADVARTILIQRDEAREELRRIDNVMAFDEAWPNGVTLSQAVEILMLQRDRVKAQLSDALAALRLCRDVIGPPEDETWAPDEQVQQAYAAAVALVGPAAPCPTP